jgi:hypothetical protein
VRNREALVNRRVMHGEITGVQRLAGGKRQSVS